LTKKSPNTERNGSNLVLPALKLKPEKQFNSIQILEKPKKEAAANVNLIRK
jgi:hypothetical protein